MLGRCHLPIKTVLFWHTNLLGTDMPFTDIASPITCLLEGFAYRGVADRYMCLGTVAAIAFVRLKVSGEANSLGILARQ